MLNRSKISAVFVEKLTVDVVQNTVEKSAKHSSFQSDATVPLKYIYI